MSFLFPPVFRYATELSVMFRYFHYLTGVYVPTYLTVTIKTEEVQNFESTGKYPSAALPAGKPRFKIEDFEGKAGITVILLVALQLKNKVFNYIFFSMIFKVSV